MSSDINAGMEILPTLRFIALKAIQKQPEQAYTGVSITPLFDLDESCSSNGARTLGNCGVHTGKIVRVSTTDGLV